MVFDLLLLRQVILLAGCTAAAYTDAKTGLIVDKITYPMIAAGIALNLLEAEWVFLVAGAAVFAIGYAIYYMGKIGGGDVKLFTGIVFLLPVLQGKIFILNALFAACILAVSFYSTYYVAKYARKGIDWQRNRKSTRKALFFGAGIAAYLSAITYMQIVAWQTAAILAMPLMLALLFLAFEKGIRHRFFLKEVKLQNLEEDEVIATEFLNQKTKKTLNLKLKGVFGEKEKAMLQSIGVKTVPVYRGMPPFAPFILLGCIIAILQPDLLGLLFA